MCNNVAVQLITKLMTNRFSRISKDQIFPCRRDRKTQIGRCSSNNEEIEWQGRRKQV